MNSVDYARRELELAGLLGQSDPCNNRVGEAVMELIKVLAGQRHSVFSVWMVRENFIRLANRKPLSPITDEPDQWIALPESERGNGYPLQHKRYASVFKDASGSAFDVDAVLFRDEGGGLYFCRESTRPITFPYSVPDHPEILNAPPDVADV